MATIKERISKTGEKSYTVVIRIKGTPHQYATFARKTDAHKWAKVTEAAIMESRHFLTNEDKARTFSDMIERYLEEIAPIRHQKPEASRAIRRHLNWWNKQLGSYLLAKVSPKEIARCRSQLLSEPALDSYGDPVLDENGNPKRNKSPATVVRYLASLSVVYTAAVNEWEWLQVNPVKKVARPKEPRGRVRYLSDEERPRLLDACKASSNPYLYAVVVLALSTGARKNEILKLKWHQVDLSRNVIRLEDTKNDERRAIPLVGKAFDLISNLHKQAASKDGYIFPAPDRKKPINIKRAWDAALERANIEDFRFHDLRHSAASYLAMNGATLAEIAEVLGHKTLQMVKRYAHMSEQHTIAVVERMNSKIF